MDDQYETMRCYDSLVTQINNVLCFITKFQLLMSYCFSLYGSVLWNVCNGYVEHIHCTESWYSLQRTANKLGFARLSNYYNNIKKQADKTYTVVSTMTDT